jgi:integrase
VLTVARSTEGRDARWPEIDGAVWSIPPERIKASLEHRVPLSEAVLALVHDAQAVRRARVPGMKGAKPVSDTALAKLLDRMG